MLTHTGACLRELVRSFPDEHSLSSTALRKIEIVALVRQKSDEGRQEIAFGARPFILCGLPIRRLSNRYLRCSRRNGRFLLEIVGDPDYGLPFGQDRLWNRRVNRDRIRTNWKFDRTAARQKFGYQKQSFKRSKN